MTIKATGFGWIETDRARFDYDIVIYPDGRVERRFPNRFGDSHTITLKEVQRVLANTKASLVMGTGQAGVAEVAKEAKDFLKANGIEFKIAPTPEAILIYNQLSEPKAAIFHITC
ncbi:MAG: MTH938/NDUFAF3 family protein [candidate division WOR-3 bacterium]